MGWADKVNEALGYIEAHLQEELTVEKVGRAVHYAPSALQSMFGAITGYTIGEYIRFRRLSQAAEALAAGRSVTDCALDCGYETTEAFSKAFKRLFGCPPSQFDRASAPTFAPLRIQVQISGGFGMTRNLIPGLFKVDWSDTARQNEYVNSVISALNALGERLTYDYVCAVSGCAFRTSFSMPSVRDWNHGNYHVSNTPPIPAHTFKMLGYAMSEHVRGDFESDRRLVMDSIDRGVPVVTLEGVVKCADACVISGYDNNGRVLLGYSPFQDIQDDHPEPPDGSGYFRKTDWHDSFFSDGSQGSILIIGDKLGKPSPEEILAATLQLAKKLILLENLVPGQYNGLAAHRAFANALQTYEWTDNFDPYLNVMCNYKQYLDRQYAVSYLRQNGREDLAAIYEEIAGLAALMGRQIPQDFSAGGLFSDKANLKPFCGTVLRVCALEERAAKMM